MANLFIAAADWLTRDRHIFQPRSPRLTHRIGNVIADRFGDRIAEAVCGVLAFASVAGSYIFRGILFGIGAFIAFSFMRWLF